MPGLYRDEGVVLRAIKLGEADRIVTIFTQGNGKIRAVAKGIRKTTSKFGARLEPMSRVALQCYKGRELDIVTQAESLDSNRVLREEYSLLTRSVPMLEAVDQVAQDREPNPAMYRMLTGALHALATTRNPLVTPAFFWKLLSLEGFHPLLDGCARCGAPPDEAPGGDHELIAFVQAMLSNFDRELREPAVLAQAISDNKAQWVMLYQASLGFEDRHELSG